jgi:vacuolar-type H+-ATPase subunit E/Vma4
MSDQPEINPQDPSTSTPNWSEVGRQFQNLGESLAAAIRSSMDNENNRQHLTRMRDGLEEMVKEVNQAIKEGSSSPQAQQFKEDMKQAARSARDVGQKTAEDVRPHLTSALRQVSIELQKLAEKLDKE